MRLLLDTAVVLWLLGDDNRLSSEASDACGDSGNELVLSVVSVWEIGLKHRSGKLPLPAPLAELLRPLSESRGVSVLELSEAAVLVSLELPEIHRDPFDRVLIGQAMAHGLTLVTPDEMIRRYPVPTLW